MSSSAGAAEADAGGQELGAAAHLPQVGLQHLSCMRDRMWGTEGQDRYAGTTRQSVKMSEGRRHRYVGTPCSCRYKGKQVACPVTLVPAGSASCSARPVQLLRWRRCCRRPCLNTCIRHRGPGPDQDPPCVGSRSPNVCVIRHPHLWLHSLGSCLRLRPAAVEVA